MSPAAPAHAIDPNDVNIRLVSDVSDFEQEPGFWVKHIHLKGAQLKLFSGQELTDYDPNNRAVGKRIVKTVWAEFSNGRCLLPARLWKERGKTRKDVLEVLDRHIANGHRFRIENRDPTESPPAAK